MTLAFASIDAFLSHLGRVASAGSARSSMALRDAAEVLQVEAKSYLGHYQGAMGPFAAWAPLSERTQKDRERRGFRPNDPELVTGALQEHIDISYDAKHAVMGVPDETVGDGSHENPTRNIGDIAIEQEMGTSRIPPRSFLGRAGYVKGLEAAHTAAHVLTDAFVGKPYRKPKIGNVNEAPF